MHEFIVSTKRSMGEWRRKDRDCQGPKTDRKLKNRKQIEETRDAELN